MASFETLIWIFLATGFTVGFGHCLGMCGPVVIGLSLNLKGSKARLPLLLYHSGRMSTYAILGGIMGMTGSFTGVAARMAGLQKGAMITAGLMVVAMGLVMGSFIPSVTGFKNNFEPQGFILKGFNRLTRSISSLNYYLVGLLLGFLPCGPVYTVLVASARAGMDAATALTGFIHGMILMSVFGLGTLPSLWILGQVTSMGWITKRPIIYKAGAVLMIVTGFVFVVQGIRY